MSRIPFLYHTFKIYGELLFKNLLYMWAIGIGKWYEITLILNLNHELRVVIGSLGKATCKIYEVE